MKKKVEMKTLLDNNRSRNIEIFLPRFPLALDTLEMTLSDHLNNINESMELVIDHIVALKRYETKISISVRCYSVYACAACYLCM